MILQSDEAKNKEGQFFTIGLLGHKMMMVLYVNIGKPLPVVKI